MGQEKERGERDNFLFFFFSLLELLLFFYCCCCMLRWAICSSKRRLVRTPLIICFERDKVEALADTLLLPVILAPPLGLLTAAAVIVDGCCWLRFSLTVATTLFFSTATKPCAVNTGFCIPICVCVRV